MTPELGDDWTDPDDGQCNNGNGLRNSKLTMTLVVLFTSIMKMTKVI